ncbi:MAG: response regulator [Planctomycetota bacterium]|jgi:DNA-binding NarL/FixJ family response regulator
MMSRKTKVLCVDDHAFLAEGLRSKISLESDMDFVGWLPDATNLVKEVEERKPDVVTLDIEMPGPDPFEALSAVTRRCPDARVIVLSAYIRDRYLDAAVESGAWGFLSKADDPDTIVQAIRRVADGEFAIGPSVEGRLPLEAVARRGRKAVKLQSRSNLLTTRESQILRMIGRGMSRNEIAKELFRSSKTIDAHQQSIMKKLDLHDRVELVRYAIREGLVEP